MRSAQLLRNDSTIRLLRPFWDTSWSQKFGRSSLTRKKQEECDPYERNYSFAECDQFTKVSGLVHALDFDRANTRKTSAMVTIIGAAGRVGKTLSLLLKTCPLIDHLCLFDTDRSIKGVGVDVSHIDTRCCISYVCGMRNIQQALNAPDVVIIAAGCPASPNLSGRKLFERNAPIVAGLSEACARFCPKACVVLITSPINSLLPVMGEVYQIITNRIPSRKMFGLTTLDVVRANTFVAEVIRKDPNNVIVPVIGGTSQETLVPVISQMKPCCQIKRGEMIALTECLKRAEENLIDCQNCGTRGASTLSTAYAGFRFTTSLVMALKGAENIIECAFVKSDVIPELEYLASPLKLGIRGIEYNFGYPPLSDYEVSLMEQAALALINDIEMGKCFVEQHKKKLKTLHRRCCSCKPESFLNIRSNLPNKHCHMDDFSEEWKKFDNKIVASAEIKPCVIDAIEKKNPEEHFNDFSIFKQQPIENSINLGKKKSRDMVLRPTISIVVPKGVALKNICLRETEEYIGKEDECGKEDKCQKATSKVEKPDKWHRISRKEIFFSTIEAKDSAEEVKSQ